MLSHFSRVRLFVTLWIAARQAPLSMGFFRQEYWSGLPCPPPGDLPDSEIKPTSKMALVLSKVLKFIEMFRGISWVLKTVSQKSRVI